MSDAGVSWAWYAGGWDNAAGNIGGPGWTNGFGPTCTDPNVSTADGKTWPFCPDSSFQFHHQPFNYFLRYAPGTVGPGRHLKDEVAFLDAAKAGHLPQVSFVKPLGNENEHPGYSSEPNGSDHLVDLIQAIETGPQAEQHPDRRHVRRVRRRVGPRLAARPRHRRGAHDLFGPGTRVPALLIARRLQPRRASTTRSTTRRRSWRRSSTSSV